MKNKGFAITGILYSILILFLILLALLIFSLQSKKTILDRLKSDTMDNIEGIVKGKSSDNTSGPTIDITDQYSSTGVKQLGLKGVVYLDPTDLNKTCTADNSTIGSGTSGCMKWYIYDDSDNNYKMILDHNTENGVVWNNSLVNTTYASSGAYISIQNLVNNNNWDSSLNTTIITVAEIISITDKSSFNYTDRGSYYFFTDPDKGHTPVATGKGTSKYAWLYDYTNDCASYGCNVSTSGTGDYGYWTQDPVGTDTSVWLVDRNDSLYPIDVNHGSRGVRPVITVSKSIINTNTCPYEENHEFTFDYTGSVQTFNTPCSGNYKLEVWGAEGYKYNSTYYGGYGGYSVGNVSLDANTAIYIFVGEKGKGGTVTSSTTTYSSYPNGGMGVNGYSPGAVYIGSGGGSTHISKMNSIISNHSTSDLDKLLIVAGGGGSCIYYTGWAGAGGHAGGYIGSTGTRIITDSGNWQAGTGGSQNAGGIYTYTADQSTQTGLNGLFGQGGSATTNNGLYGSGGGGGYYGGAASFGSSGGGGSGYIGNNSLFNKHMTCYECDTAYQTNVKTISNTNVSATATSDYSKSGNGYAKITYLGKNKNNNKTKYTITNMIKNGSFEDDFDEYYGLADNASISSTESAFGSKSYKRSNSTVAGGTGQYINLIEDHIYYYFLHAKTNSLLIYSDVSWTGWGIQANSTNWKKFSAYETSSVTGKKNISLNYGYDINVDTYVDGVGFVDLTEAFGAGNEPSKEWCDINIDYFDGTKTIYK